MISVHVGRGVGSTWLRATFCSLAAVLFLVFSASCTLIVTPSQRSDLAQHGANSAPALIGRGGAAQAADDRDLRWPLRFAEGLPDLSGQDVSKAYWSSKAEDRAASAALYAFSIRVADDKQAVVEMPERSVRIGDCWVRWFGDDYPDQRAGDTVAGEPARMTVGSNSAFQVCCWHSQESVNASTFEPELAGDQLFQRAEALAKSGDFRQDFAIWLPDSGGPTAPTPRGLCVVLSPISNGEYTLPVLNELRRRGWALLMQTRVEFKLRMLADRPDEVRLAGDRVLQNPGKFARELDDDLADQAFVVEAALKHVRRMHPNLFPGESRTALIGFSLGALVGVTSAARISDDLDAAVFVGGGTHMGPVLVRSNVLRDAEGELIFKIPENRIAQLELDYLAASRMDAYHTAGRLRNTPVLLIDGARDGTIAPRYATLLWQRLGMPERWTVDGGHSWLFLTLDQLAPDIADWLDRTGSGSP